ncbi:hypothetical protein GALL_467600 [mine drainage metagenome]|uniref:Uncharacterized protein n=1 Tax=mine drainage metagenome TaxID=410659 RepID=A0A1J5Q2C2_9ZZZZ
MPVNILNLSGLRVLDFKEYRTGISHQGRPCRHLQALSTLRAQP